MNVVCKMLSVLVTTTNSSLTARQNYEEHEKQFHSSWAKQKFTNSYFSYLSLVKVHWNNGTIDCNEQRFRVNSNMLSQQVFKVEICPTIQNVIKNRKKHSKERNRLLHSRQPCRPKNIFVQKIFLLSLRILSKVIS